ncbi:uncharacterized protein LOC116843615 isoform X2 [Odontomachus brunneus]|uniref:uncharacterized protein LOC116843615 isoform X2 n=1 Tax=Odontomachus brunneus TaxID=486640 RepID=UPI0013F20E56|nr:uncharacterized protein LOC116843615 isoform X2 [Odontomachus brunneus]
MLSVAATRSVAGRTLINQNRDSVQNKSDIFIVLRFVWLNKESYPLAAMEIRSREHIQELQKLLREVEPADEPMDEESSSEDQQSSDTELLGFSIRKDCFRPRKLPNIQWLDTPQETERQKTDQLHFFLVARLELLINRETGNMYRAKVTFL